MTIFSKIAFLFTFFLFCGLANAQGTYNSKDEADKNSGKGIVFKTPDNFMNAPLSGFKGLMMLNANAPAVIVISYPNENESVENLTKRIVKFVPTLFGDDKQKEPEWTSKPIDVNPGDKPNSGFFYSAKSGESALQLALFQREWKGLTVLYGYFAMRNGNSKEKELKKYWMDDTGRGIKPFEAFWKSFPTKN